MTTSLACLHCNGILGPGDRFCAHCGAELWWCSGCGQFLLHPDEPCPRCGGQPRRTSDLSAKLDLVTEEESPWTEVLHRLRRATQGEFEIGHELGRGGMAAVFMAHELSLHRDVAIKVMSPGLLMGDGMVERFRREAITIAHLNHPNIVSVHSVRAAEGLHFFVMRCIQGRSLDQIIGQAGKLPLPIVRSILSHVGSALAYAHRFKVVHRDIKPANILVDEEGNAVVTDFGIAKVAEGPSQTHTGFMVGTPAYMSPEQCTGGKVSGASDQYSLGAVAYEMIAGTPPFTGSTYTVIQAHVEQAPRALGELCDCPKEVEEAIHRMLAKSPDDRWPGMSQALSALGAAVLAEDDPLRRKLIELATPAERTGLPAWARGVSLKAPGTQRTPSRSNANLTIVPPPPHLEVGDSFLLVARVQDSRAARLPAGPVEWSSDSPDVLRVNAKAVATAISPGSAVVRATCDGNQGRLRVIVLPPQADVIAVTPIEKPIKVGDEIQLEATARDKRGRAVTRPVTWRSEDDAVATVSLDGILVARSGGTVRVVAELDQASDEITLTVVSQKVAAVHISGVPQSVVAGDSFALTATPLDRWAGALKGRSVSWTVSDVALAIVAAGGWVVTRKPGSVILTAVCEGVSASVSIDILQQAVPAEPAELASASSTASSWPEPEAAWEPRFPPASRERRHSARRRALAGGIALLLTGGVLVVGSRGSLRWPANSVSGQVADDSIPAGNAANQAPKPVPPLDSSSDSLPAGSAETAAPRDSAQLPTNRPAVTPRTTRPPSPAQPRSIAIAAREPLRVGEVATLELTPPGVRRRQRANWSSADTRVALIDAVTGKVEARDVGTTQITARVGADSATFSLTVLAQPVASIDINGVRPLKVGDSLKLTADVRDRLHRPLDGRAVTWSSDDPGVAGVDSLSGVVIAAAPGSTGIVAASESTAGRVRITVLSPPQTARAEVEVVDRQPPAASPANPAADRELLVTQMMAGVEECYTALRTKDLTRTAELYRPATKVDRENLKKLSGILRRQEWDADVGIRKDGSQKIAAETAAMDFGFPLTWKDAFGGHVRRDLQFRAEFTRNGQTVQLTSCRIVGSAKL
ncbi:MAG TPA: protein kinase [Gemmatimonadales bacterium]|nr:protein kinase [Gemmatimonadales bacterium]